MKNFQEEVMDNTKLINIAREAREYAYSPLSGFKVGVALLTECGKVFTGCNVEDPSGIGVTNTCAERCAIVKAVSEGYRKFTKIAVVGGMDDDTDTQKLCLPCGACRQFIHGFNLQIIIVGLDDGVIKEFPLDELLPCSFNL